MQSLHDVVAALAMLALSVIATANDLHHRKIPNPLVITGIICGLGLSVITAGIEGAITSLAGFGVGFLLLLPGYLLRFTGAGDVKLVATLGLFCGPAVILQIFAASVFVAAFFVLLRAAWKRFRNSDDSFLLRYKSMPQMQVTAGRPGDTPSARNSVMKQRLPMAPFYTLGLLVILIIPLV
jgi:prepilin peptidase CpaA